MHSFLRTNRVDSEVRTVDVGQQATEVVSETFAFAVIVIWNWRGKAKRRKSSGAARAAYSRGFLSRGVVLSRSVHSFWDRPCPQSVWDLHRPVEYPLDGRTNC